MTTLQKRLDRLKYLEGEIAMNEDILAQIDADFCKITSTLSDMPKSKDNQNRWPELLDKKIKVQNIINERTQELAPERLSLIEYIESIEDIYIRQIFLLRYKDGLSWRDVARNVGGKNTADSVRKACERYIQKTNVVRFVR